MTSDTINIDLDLEEFCADETNVNILLFRKPNHALGYVQSLLRAHAARVVTQNGSSGSSRLKKHTQILGGRVTRPHSAGLIRPQSANSTITATSTRRMTEPLSDTLDLSTYDLDEVNIFPILDAVKELKYLRRLDLRSLKLTGMARKRFLRYLTKHVKTVCTHITSIILSFPAGEDLGHALAQNVNYSSKREHIIRDLHYGRLHEMLNQSHAKDKMDFFHWENSERLATMSTETEMRTAVVKQFTFEMAEFRRRFQMLQAALMFQLKFDDLVEAEQKQRNALRSFAVNQALMIMAVKIVNCEAIQRKMIQRQQHDVFVEAKQKIIIAIKQRQVQAAGGGASLSSSGNNNVLMKKPSPIAL
eukprot:PhF_6_TR10998/c0_g1_i1/m.17802